MRRGSGAAAEVSSKSDQLNGEIQKHQMSQSGIFFSPMTNPLNRIMSETSGPAMPTATWLLWKA